MLKTLSAAKGKSAGAALARRAVFDLDPELREAAVNALRDRPPAEYRPALLEALRYPWAPVADHAAEALVDLDDREAVPDLAGLLDKPDPRVPSQTEDKKWVAAEVVRVNHLGNCALCHAPSYARDDPVRGVVPERGQPLPVEAYYQSKSGSFVRADVTYLRQDFSLMRSVPKPDQWPEVQRFDYLVRRRELSDDEVKRLTAAPVDYPQRQAVLWALRELTGHDTGTTSAAWQRYAREKRPARDP
jgi:hypothetical protein